jgi:hypothetical protein
MSAPKRSWIPVKFSTRSKNRETPEPETGSRDYSVCREYSTPHVLLEEPDGERTRRVYVNAPLACDGNGIRGHFVCSHKYRVKATTVYLCPPGIEEPVGPERGVVGHTVDAREFDIEADTVYLCSKEMAELLARMNDKTGRGGPYYRSDRDYRYP